MSYARHLEVSVDVAAAPAVLFDHLDNQERLAAHMNQPSAMMLGGRMFYELDALRGRAAGAVIRMGGNFLWLNLVVEEIVTEHERPRAKSWETRGQPRLIIIDHYRMGFKIDANGEGSRLRVLIDYDLPRTVFGCLLGSLLAPIYARWCVERMAKDAQRTFRVVHPRLTAARRPS
jgi:hypothetical protein